MNRIENILNDIVSQGYTSDNIKKSVIKTLRDFFENESNLVEFAMTGDVLQMWGFILSYYYDSSFISNLKFVLGHYRRAYAENPLEVIKIYENTFNYFINRENIMWSVGRNKLDFENTNLHDLTASCMNRIGSSLEINLKSYLIEFYALLRIIKKSPMEIEKIKEFNFGVIVNNILDIYGFDNILKVSPSNLKISDWRNIAYHHTYVIDNNRITCDYGKNKKQVIIDRSQLINYTHEIVKCTNIFYIAHWIFLFDHLGEIVEKCKRNNLKLINGQDEIWKQSLRISLLGQGYQLLELQTSEMLTNAKLHDMLNTGNLDEDYELRRKIHASQFLYNLWSYFPSKTLSIDYYDKSGQKKYIFKVSGEVCELIGKGEKELRYLAGKVEFIKV